jgi:hypothetical protein
VIVSRVRKWEERVERHHRRVGAARHQEAGIEIAFHRRDLARPCRAQVILQRRRGQIEMVLHRQDEIELLHACELGGARHEQMLDRPPLAGDRVLAIRGLIPRLMMPMSRKGRGEKKITHRPVPIPESLAERLTGRKGTLLLRPDDEPWAKTNLPRHFEEVLKGVKLGQPKVTIYALRHTSIVWLTICACLLRSHPESSCSSQSTSGHTKGPTAFPAQPAEHSNATFPGPTRPRQPAYRHGRSQGASCRHRGGVSLSARDPFRTFSDLAD